MKKVRDIKWRKGMAVSDLVSELGMVGFQGVELEKAVDTIIMMKREGAKIYLTFTSNMVTSGLRGLFAQMVRLGLVDVIVTTAGGIEEDIMRALGEEFLVGSYRSDDISLHEKGLNRVGNLMITNESYSRFEDYMLPALRKIYAKKKRLSVTEFLSDMGLMLDDEDSFLCQAARKNIPVFCPAITDGSIGFQLYMFQQDNPDFMVDVVSDFSALLSSSSFDDRKGVIALGGGVSKHHAILGLLLNGGCDYAVYMTTSHSYSGSMGGATTHEGKTWGKVKIDASEVTVIGDVSILFPVAMMRVMDVLHNEGLIE